MTVGRSLREGLMADYTGTKEQAMRTRGSDRQLTQGRGDRGREGRGDECPGRDKSSERAAQVHGSLHG